VAALLLTHGHRDHVGSAAWLHDQHGVPARAHVDELAHVRGERTEEITKRGVAGKLGRRGALLWVLSIALPLGGFRVDHVREASTFTDGVRVVRAERDAWWPPGITFEHASGEIFVEPSLSDAAAVAAFGVAVLTLGVVPTWLAARVLWLAGDSHRVTADDGTSGAVADR
jgi:hypothetical protein